MQEIIIKKPFTFAVEGIHVTNFDAGASPVSVPGEVVEFAVSQGYATKADADSGPAGGGSEIDSMKKDELKEFILSEAEARGITLDGDIDSLNKARLVEAAHQIAATDGTE